jgi:hypothetical protein
MKLDIQEEQRNRLREIPEQDKLRELELAEQRRLQEERREREQKPGFRLSQQVRDLCGKVKKGES